MPETLSPLKLKKQVRMNLMLRKATKKGQIRAFERQIFLAEQEIQKELHDLEIIEEDIHTMNREINAPT